MRIYFLLIAFSLLVSCEKSEKHNSESNAMYMMNDEIHTRWTSFENPSAAKGEGGKDNKGAKGHAFERIEIDETKTLLKVQGSGVIRRMWITILQRDPETLRGLKIQMYWDGGNIPAVSVPFGDFFGSILGRNFEFENALFSNPEARSYNFNIPMPFRKGAKIELVNETGKKLSHVFYDINYTEEDVNDEALYFHAWWLHDNPNELGKDFSILPRIEGKGKYLGAHVGVIDDSIYQKNWWGEGEVKIYLDGDKEYPTLIGSGTEDYIGTGWGQGQYFTQYQGCTIASWPYYGFYRYHIPDPVYFHKDIRVDLQVIGGTSDREQLIRMTKDGVPMIPVSIDGWDETGVKEFHRLLDMKPVPKVDDPTLPHGHMNYYRQADISAVVFFYLDKPVSTLAKIESVEKRIKNLN